jgi:hypothetical protein
VPRAVHDAVRQLGPAAPSGGDRDPARHPRGGPRSSCSGRRRPPPGRRRGGRGAGGAGPPRR